MAPKRGARRGATARRGRNAGRGAGERVEDEISYHGENPVEQEAVPPPPVNQNPTDPILIEILAALTAQNLHHQTNRANQTSRALEATREFRRMDPPRFDGLASDPLAADHWLAEIREMFEVLDITDDQQRVKLVTCQLVGEAKEWWKSLRAERKDARRNARATLGIEEPDVEDMTWDEFERKFDGQYFPRSYRENLRQQFEKLEQGTMTVAEYVIKFQALARFAPEMVSSEDRKSMRFARGLRPSIRRTVLGGTLERFTETVEVARRLEEDEEETRGARKAEPRQPYPSNQVTSGTFSGQSRKRSRELMQSTSGHSIARTPTYSGTGGSQSRPTIICHNCGQPGHYRSQCPQRKASPPPPRVRTPGTCYDCGERGHIARFCPRKGGSRSESGSVQQPRQEQGWQQQGGSQEQPFVHQTTGVHGKATGDRGASSSVQPPVTKGRAYNIMTAIPPAHQSSSQAPDRQTVRGTFILYYFVFLPRCIVAYVLGLETGVKGLEIEIKYGLDMDVWIVA